MKRCSSSYYYYFPPLNIETHGQNNSARAAECLYKYADILRAVHDCVCVHTRLILFPCKASASFFLFLLSDSPFLSNRNAELLGVRGIFKFNTKALLDASLDLYRVSSIAILAPIDNLTFSFLLLPIFSISFYDDTGSRLGSSGRLIC